MSVRIEHDAENNSYSLGDDIDGVFIPFATVDGAAVAGRVSDAKAAAAAAAASEGTAGATVSGNQGDDFSASDFTDNGDGTFTRNADQVKGRFTPSGFEPVAAP